MKWLMKMIQKFGQMEYWLVAIQLAVACHTLLHAQQQQCLQRKLEQSHQERIYRYNVTRNNVWFISYDS